MDIGMNIGEKIKRLRVTKGLTQEELASRTELSKGFISQLERDLASPSIATLVDVLNCLGTSLKEFFGETVEEKIVFGREEVFTKEVRESMHDHDISWLIPNSQKNMMEPILLTLYPDGMTQADNPHEGEEFGFVLEGSVNIHLGGRKFRCRRHESFYFRPSSEHLISNTGRKMARLLWISSPPSF